MTAISAAFADFRIVKGRKVAQLIFETPLETADEALRMLGGLPRPDAERWVGIAPLVGRPEAEQRPAPDPEKVKERKPFHTLPRSQQAAILINDAAFQSWVGSNRTPEETDQMLKAHMGITSKRDLDRPAHAEKWDRMVATFRADAGRQTWERPA